jgi:hypothetical protein
MGDISLVSDIVIAMCEGIQSKKQIKAYYAKYENSFEFNSEEIEKEFDEIISLIKLVFNEGIKNTPFKRIHLFYTLFASFYHTKYGLKNFVKERQVIEPNRFERVKNSLTGINILFESVPPKNMTAAQIQFLEDSRRATTDTKVRVRRSEFIIDIINSL